MGILDTGISFMRKCGYNEDGVAQCYIHSTEVHALSSAARVWLDEAVQLAQLSPQCSAFT